MNAVIDYGNSRIKVGLFDQFDLGEVKIFAAEDELVLFLNRQSISHLIISSVTKSGVALLQNINASGEKFNLDHKLPLPITLNYSTPDTLGVDRIAAACGAIALRPDQETLVIDAGTCINYEFIDANATYHGGSIAPGISMRFNAMHTFTSRLPLVKAVSTAPLIGSSTESCMQSGVMNGVLAETNGIIELYKKKYPNMRVIFCGGDSSFFENNLKHPIFVAPNLVLIGLNGILLHNVAL